MQLLIIGSKKKWALENHYKRHLEALCETVDFFEAHDMFYDYYYKSIINKVIFRLGFDKIYKRINRQLLEKLKENNYDLIWIFKGMELYPKTLKEIREKGIKLVNYNPDDPFNHVSRGSGNQNVLKGVPYYDLHLCYNLRVKRKISNDYGIKSKWLPFGFEKNTKNSIPFEDEEIIRACFIGNPDNIRKEKIIKLAEAGIPIDIYGNQWSNWIDANKYDNLKCFEAIYQNDFIEIATKYRLHLNFFRPHNNNSHNMRSFEIPGIGCIMLAPKSEEHELLFEKNQEVFFYENDQEMINKTKVILNLSFLEAKNIRIKCRNKCYQSGYDYDSRAKQVYDYFTEII
jgi:hypothetical protein